MKRIVIAKDLWLKNTFANKKVKIPKLAKESFTNTW